ncbi:MBL fold metallo-hydrolase [Porticoccus sp.]|nr:MAG: MBL fold metallo-hydrolase [Gammaproteobacteria bacterium]
MLKIKFIGATKWITGSCSWLWHTDSNTQFLVDCGMHQGTHEEQWNNYQPFEFDATRIQYVLLTHAHIDHCGLLPKLIQNGFKGWVYCTQATREIAELMLRDSAKVSDLFKESDVDKIKWHAIDSGNFNWNKRFRLADGLWIEFSRGSHVLGACGITIAWRTSSESDPTKSIHFSGDIGNQLDENCFLPLLKDDHNPNPKANYILVESTYGADERDSLYKNAQNRINTLGDIICNTVYKKGGNVVIPAFSFHRTQEIIADLLAWQWHFWPKSEHSGLMGYLQPKKDGSGDEVYSSPLRVLCESPLAAKINQVYASQLQKRLANGKYQYLNPELTGRLNCSEEESSQIFRELTENQHTIFKKGHLVRCLSPEPITKEKFQKQLDRYPVVIASSGMCDHGPVKKHIDKHWRDPKNTIVLTGFQAQGTRGRALLDYAESPTQNGKLAEVINLSGFYSGHADQAKLLDYLFSLGSHAENSNSACVFINHGESTSKNALRDAILNRSNQKRPGDRTINSVQIAKSEWFDLNSGSYIQENRRASSDLIEHLIAIEEKLSLLIERKHL